MKLIRDVSRIGPELQMGAVAIGNFDGVHLGHARIVERLLAKAREVGGPAVVFTFDPHPVRLLRPREAPPPLTWTDRKADLLSRLGVDAIIAYPTDESLLKLGPREFFELIVERKLRAQAMVEGENFFFGHQRAGTIDVLRELTASRGILLEVVKPLVVDGAPVSSSRVRGLIAQGAVGEAARLLVEPYRIRGMVVHGAGRGAQLGFATANLDAVDTLVPGPGVYAGRGHIGAGTFAAAIHIGPNPTFAERAMKIEVHLVGWSDPLYGEAVEVDFLARLREIHRFTNTDELKEQLAKDVKAAGGIFAENSHQPGRHH